MKKLFLLVLPLLFLWQVSFSQMFMETFDHLVRDSATVKINLIGTGMSTPPSTSDRPYMKMTDEKITTPFQGDGYLTIDWKVFTNQSYGGYLALNKMVPLKTNKYLDLSGATHLSLYYYNWNKCSKGAGTVQFRLKLHDGSTGKYWDSTVINNNKVEDWYYQTTAVYDAEPGWKQLLIPLKEVANPVGAGPSDQGFSIPGWSGIPGDGKLNLDKICGFTIEWTAGVLGPDSIATGKISFDNFRLSGEVYPPMCTFENLATDPSLKVDWKQGASSLNFSNNTVNPFEGNTSLQVDWKCDMPESWGGGTNFSIRKKGSFYPSLGGNLNLVFWYKNELPSSTKGLVSLRFKLLDSSTTSVEEWFHNCSVNLDTVTNGWQSYTVPLAFFKSGDFDNDGKKGFVQPSWAGAPKGDQILNYDKIIGFVLEFSGAGAGQGKFATGKINFDYLVPNGYKESDTTAPVPPTQVMATKGKYQNLITWADVPNETGASYNVYYSDKAITDVKAKGVEVVRLGITEGTQLATHVLFSPNTDQSTTYYYAVNAVDKVGNIGKPAASVTATNTAKGVTSISITTPTSIINDTKFVEWANVKPISMKSSDGSAFIVTNSKVDGDADCSTQMYLAIDKKFLWVAFDVTDDIVSASAQSSSWLNDSPDLFIGLYDWHGAPHTGLDKNDFHFRFNADKAILDNFGGATVLVPGNDYVWKTKFPTGYVVKAKISLDSMAKIAGGSLFVPQEGMRIPLDAAINDADATGTREGILTLSPNNEDKSWGDVSRWVYTWVGNKWFVKVNQLDDIAKNYELSQNYPNPFNPTTQIKYSIQKAGMVKLTIFDVLGREIASLVNQNQNIGSYVVDFNAANKISSGTYFYKLEAGDFSSIKKMMFIK